VGVVLACCMLWNMDKYTAYGKDTRVQVEDAVFGGAGTSVCRREGTQARAAPVIAPAAGAMGVCVSVCVCARVRACECVCVYLCAR